MKKNVENKTNLEEVLLDGQSFANLEDRTILFKQIVETAFSHWTADFVIFYDFNKERGEIQQQPVYSGELLFPQFMAERDSTIIESQSIARRMVGRTHPFYGQDVESALQKLIKNTLPNPDDFIHREKITSLVAIPLRAQNECQGVLILGYRSKYVFSKKTRRIIEIFCTQAALSIQNSRLLDSARQSSHQSNLLREVSFALSQITGLTEISGTILDGLKQVIGYDKATIQRILKDHRQILAYRGFKEEEIEPQLLGPIYLDPLITRVFKNKKPLIIKDTREDPDWTPLPSTANIRSWVGIPLFFNNNPVGLLTLDHNQPNYYTPAVANLLEGFSNYAAIALGKELLLGDAKRGERDLRVLNEITQKMSNELDEKQLLKIIIQRIRKELDCSHCSVFYLKNENGKSLLAPFLVDSDEAEKILSRRFLPGEGIVGMVFKNGNPIIVPDVSKEKNFSPSRYNPEKPRSMLAVPLRASDQIIGVICADNMSLDAFTENEMELVVALARQAGNAIQRNRNLKRMQEISERINSAEAVDEILKLIVSSAIEMTKMSSGVIYLVDKRSWIITSRYIAPEDSFHPEPRMYRKDGVTRRVISTGEVIIFRDIKNDRTVNSKLRQNTRSMIALPIRFEKDVLGVLFLNDENKHEFNEPEITLLTNLGDQAAIAIKKAALLEEANRQLKRHQALNSVAADLTSKQDENEILRTVAQATGKAVGCSHCSVFRIEKDEMIVAASHGDLEHTLQPGRKFRVGQGLAGQVAKTGRADLVSDTFKRKKFDRKWSFPPPRSLVMVPIFLDKKIYGVISAESTDRFAFDEQDKQLMETFASQVSQALRSARRIRDLQDLNSAGHSISAKIDIDILLETLLKIVNKTLKSQYSTLFVIDEESGDLVYRARSPERENPSPLRFKIGQGLAGKVALTKKSLIVGDVRKNQNFFDISKTIDPNKPHSICLAPMILQNRVTGVISVDKEELNGFDSSDMSLLETLSVQAAIALENARLFTESSERLKFWEEISTDLMTLDQDKLLMQIVSAAMKLTKTELGTIYLLSTDGHKIIRAFSSPPSFMPACEDLSEEGVTRQIFKSKNKIIISDTSSNTQVSAQIREEGFLSFIGFPLLVKDQVIGVLYLNDRRRREFSPSDIQLGSVFALQAAAAIQNSRQFAQINLATLVLGHVVEIVNSIGSHQMDPLPIILEETKRLFEKVDYSLFALVEPGNKRLEFHAVMEGDKVLVGDEVPPNLRYRDWGIGITGYVAETGESYSIGDISRSKIQYIPWWDDTHSELAVPLKNSNNQVIGVLNLESKEIDAFSSFDVSLCQALANVTAISIEKSYLYTKLERRARYTESFNRIANEVNNLVGQESQEAILNTIVVQACATLDALRCTFYLFNEEHELVPKTTAGNGLKNSEERVFRLGEGLIGWCAQAKVSVQIENAITDSRFSSDQQDCGDLPRRMIVAPMWLEGNVEGVLSAYRDGGEPFDEVDLRFIETLAIQAGIFMRPERIRQRVINSYQRRFNPYIVGAPIVDPKAFFGRKEILSRLLDGIHGNHFIIYGERRIGKTSMLFQIENQLNHMAISDPKYFYVPVLMSLQGVSEQEFFSFLAERVRSAAMLSVKIQFDTQIIEDELAQVLIEALSHLQRIWRDKEIRIILLIDEMDQFFCYKRIIQEKFRRLLNTQLGQRIKVVMTGVSVEYNQNITSPFFNVFQLQELMPLSESEAWELITIPVSGYYAYEPEAVNQLIEYANCKPLDLQYLSYQSVIEMLDRTQMVERGVRPSQEIPIISLIDIKNAAEKVIESKKGEYEEFWKALDKEQQNALLASAKGDGSIQIDGMRINGKPLFNKKCQNNIIFYLTRREKGRVYLSHLFGQWLTRRGK